MHDAVVAIEDEAGDRITVLVNNAGSLRAIGPLWEVDPEDWWLDVRTSLGGAFVCCREVVPRMIRHGEGRIVNLTSYVAVRPTPYQTGYAAGKAGIVSLTEALAASLEGSGVKAFSVAPGFTATEMTRHLVESEAGKRWLPDVGKGRSVDAEVRRVSSRGSRAAPAMSSTGASSTRSTIPRSCCGGSTRFGGTSSTPRDCVACRPRRSSEDGHSATSETELAPRARGKEPHNRMISDAKHDLAARERLGEPLWGDRLEAAQTHQPRERVAIEPVLPRLAREVPF